MHSGLSRWYLQASSWHLVATTLATLLVAVLGAFLFRWLDTPLPWMLGPLFAVGCLRLTGVPLHSPRLVRNVGQWVIGMALGLYFTPAVIADMRSLWSSLMLGLVFAWVMSLAFAIALRRVAKLDPVTAFFSATIGGASEMAVQAERHGARVDVVVAIHTLRVLIVVVSLPFVYRWLDLHGADAGVMARDDVFWPGLAMLAGLSVVAMLIVRQLGWPNAWMIGPLLVTIALTGSGHSPTALPDALIKLGQVFIGVSLGSRFRPESFRLLREILPLVVGATLVLIALSAGFACLLAMVNGIAVATMVLATSPGGIAEMSLTAKLLKLGVPTVTVFHVTRLAFVLMTVGPMWRLVSRHRSWQMPPVNGL